MKTLGDVIDRLRAIESALREDGEASLGDFYADADAHTMIGHADDLKTVIAELVIRAAFVGLEAPL